MPFWDRRCIDKEYGGYITCFDREGKMTDDKKYIWFQGLSLIHISSAQDHKRAGDGDTGLNTGGMGTFSPSPFYTKEVEEFCEKYIYQLSLIHICIVS